SSVGIVHDVEDGTCQRWRCWSDDPSAATLRDHVEQSATVTATDDRDTLDESFRSSESESFAMCRHQHQVCGREHAGDAVGCDRTKEAYSVGDAQLLHPDFQAGALATITRNRERQIETPLQCCGVGIDCEVDTLLGTQASEHDHAASAAALGTLDRLEGHRLDLIIGKRDTGTTGERAGQP